jgi:hypothetical protein
MKPMTITEIKEQVSLVEGFNIEFGGRSTKKINANLRARNKSPGDKSVADWIANSFPETPGDVFVLRGNGKRATRSNLANVRNSYPVDYKRGAKTLAREKAEAGAIAAKLEIKEEAVRRAKQVSKKIKKSAVLEVQTALQTGERNAAFDAIETALHNANRFHSRVAELCNTAISSGLEDTRSLIERILAVWSAAEDEKDRLNDLLKEIESHLQFQRASAESCQ